MGKNRFYDALAHIGQPKSWGKRPAFDANFSTWDGSMRALLPLLGVIEFPPQEQAAVS